MIEGASGSPSSSSPVRVVFIGGLGRSGSTLLDLMLGQLPGFCAVGELSYLWIRSDDDLCGCGERFVDCPFWVAVGEEAFGGWDQVDREKVAALRAFADRHRNIPQMIGPARAGFRRAARSYGAVTQRLYEGVRRVSGAEVIVDSTKNASTAFLLRKIEGVDLRVVHLVRDSRGVAYSWTKRIEKPGVAGGGAYMDRYDPTRMAARWLAYNGLFHLLPSLRCPSIRMRYEDLIREPSGQIERIVRLSGSPSKPPFPFLHGHQVDLRSSHTIAGNPIRFGHDTMVLRLDEAWRTELPMRSRMIVSSVTLPLLAAYGYLRRDTA